MNLNGSAHVDFKSGDDFIISMIEVLTSSNTTMSTVGYLVDFKMRHLETGVSADGIVVSVVDESVGVYKAFAPRTATLGWKLGMYEWDVSVTDSNDIKISCSTGQMRVLRGVN